MDIDNLKAIVQSSVRNQTSIEGLSDSCDKLIAIMGPFTALINEVGLDDDQREQLLGLMKELESVHEEIRQLNQASAATASAIDDLARKILVQHDGTLG